MNHVPWLFSIGRKLKTHETQVNIGHFPAESGSQVQAILVPCFVILCIWHVFFCVSHALMVFIIWYLSFFYRDHSLTHQLLELQDFSHVKVCTSDFWSPSGTPSGRPSPIRSAPPTRCGPGIPRRWPCRPRRFSSSCWALGEEWELLRRVKDRLNG